MNFLYVKFPFGRLNKNMIRFTVKYVQCNMFNIMHENIANKSVNFKLPKNINFISLSVFLEPSLLFL